MAEVSPVFLSGLQLCLHSRYNIAFQIRIHAGHMNEHYSWIAKLSNIGTQFFTSLSGKLVGTDSYGNRYFTERHAKNADGTRVRRWVMYRGRPEASQVPAEWHGWLHYSNDAPVPESARPKWGKPHLPNLTFSDDAYRPPGHFLQGGKRAPSGSDYQAWTPGE